MSDTRPLGFFDSGLGGLTVLRAIRRKFPNENLVYLGDTARLPYGTKSSDTIRRYTDQSVRALLNFDVKAIIVACNSASTAVLDSKLPGASRIESAVPVYNVIEPGAEVALKASGTKRIGVLATRATVSSGAYAKAITTLNQDATVFQHPAPLLVPLVEEGWETDPLTNLVIYRYLAPLMAQSIDTLILGCTHYPALREGIQKVTGNGIALVDSAQAIAEILYRDFKSGALKPNDAGAKGRISLYATDASPTMDSTAKRLMGDPELPSFEHCDL